MQLFDSNSLKNHFSNNQIILNQTFKMAPALTTTTTVQSEELYTKDRRQGANYKEAFQQAADTTKYDVELQGSADGHWAPAKYPNYLPCRSKRHTL